MYAGSQFQRFNVRILIELIGKTDMSTETKKRTASFMLSQEMDDKIEYLASIEARTKTYYIRRALEKYLAEYPDPTPAV
jgi:hypothetical protein